MRLRYYNTKTNDIYKLCMQYLQIRNIAPLSMTARPGQYSP